MNTFVIHRANWKSICSLQTFTKQNYHHKYSVHTNYHLPGIYNSRSSVACNTVLHGQQYQHWMFSSYQWRQFHSSRVLFENGPSKIDETVKQLKTKQKEKVDEIMKEVSNSAAAAVDENGKPKNASAGGAGSTTTVAAAVDTESKVVVKKSLLVRFWDECVHYYHGFRLLAIDVKICITLMWKILNGKTLTRRENKLLLRTTSDLFRLIPFSVFIIVPFLELLLPLFIKLFPGMLPSTFTTAKEHEDKLRQSFQMRLQMAKFLQKTLGEMPVHHKKDQESEEVKKFDEFFRRMKDPNEFVSSEEIIKYAKRFNDEITLDSLSREQLAALCRVLELNTIGTTALLRFQLRLKLRSLVADDRVIAREGVDSLDLFELQQACKSRGMRAYGLTAERLRFQLKDWIDLSLNEKVPPTLLLLSRAMLISEDGITTDKLKETMRMLPDSVAVHTKDAIGEREGKIDNKTKIEIIKDEERRIKEEREEEREEIRTKREELQDNAPIIDTDISKADAAVPAIDVQLLCDALKSLSPDKQHAVEKETIKELKEELQDYKDDVEELHEVREVIQEPVCESRAAKRLYNRVNKMINQLDKVLCDLEQKQVEIQKTEDEAFPWDISNKKKDADLVRVEELLDTIKRDCATSDESRFKTIESLMSKLDADKDGAITVNEVMETVKALECNMEQKDKKQVEELVALLTSQAQKRKHAEMVRIDDLMGNIKKLKETSNEARLRHIETVLDKIDVDKDGVLTVNEVLKVLESLGRENVKLEDKQIEELITLLEKEQILQAEEKIEKAIAKSIKEAGKLKAAVDKCIQDSTVNKISDDLTDSAKEIRDIATELGAIDKSAKKGDKVENDTLSKKTGKESETKDGATSSKDTKTPTNKLDFSKTQNIVSEVVERQIEQILPNADINSVIPPALPTNTTTTIPKVSANAAAQTKTKTKKLL